MKKSSFFAGMLTMLLILGLGGTAFAAAYQKQATLNYQGIKITLDGEEITPKDGAGNVVEPFTIDGTTYLPVRAIANAMGLEVNWNGATNTVEIAAPEMDGSTSDRSSDFYKDFSVPSLENIVGSAALVDVYELSTGDSVQYTYALKDFEIEDGKNFAEEYFAMLGEYGFTRDKSENGTVYYTNRISGITVALFMPDDYNFSVLLMNVPEGKGGGIDQEIAQYAWDISVYANNLHSLCDRVLSFMDDGVGSAQQIQDISDGYFVIPGLETLVGDKWINDTDTMTRLHTEASEYREIVMDLLLTYAKWESGEVESSDVSAYFDKEIPAYWNLLGTVKTCIGIQ